MERDRLSNPLRLWPDTARGCFSCQGMKRQQKVGGAGGPLD